MNSLFDEGPVPPCPTPFNMAAHVLNAGLATPDKEALKILSTQGVSSWTYNHLRAAVLGTATGLLNAGLAPGAIVLMRLGNTVDFPIAYLAALAAGLVPVPTSSALTEAETSFIIDTVQPAAVLLDPEIPCPPHARVFSLADIQRFHDLPPAHFHMGDPDRMGYIIFTSGTSGKPRAVMHAHRAIWARQMMFEGWYGLRPQDRLLHAGAFNWTYTLGTGLMDPWTIGATALIPVAGTSVAQLPDFLRDHAVSIFAAAPGVYRQLLDKVDHIAPGNLRHGLSAGEKLPPATALKWKQASGCPIYEAYGMSECSTFISQPPSEPIVPGTLGRPQTGRRIALLHKGTPVPIGKEGTIAVSRSDPGLMLGYLNAPEVTAACMQDDWFLTGDQGVMDPTGHIAFAGRNDDMMNPGGYRVSPLEVEAALAQMPGISTVAATAVEVKQDTQVIAAFYTGPAALDDADLRAYVAHRLAHYKQPRLYIHLTELPVGANGKILRRVLRDRFERLK